VIRVCFVCLGNICRSPTAHGIMEHLVRVSGLSDAIAVESAGTADYHIGDLPDPRTRAAARARGVELRSRARQLTADQLARYDYVLAMDESNLRDLRALAPAAARAKLYLFRSFDPDAPPGAAVPDPYYGGPSGFERVFDICEAGCRGFLDFLRREHQLS